MERDIWVYLPPTYKADSKRILSVVSYISMVADDRELTGGVIDALRRREGVSVAGKRLSLGDFLVDDTLLLERWAVKDASPRYGASDGPIFSL